VQREDGGQSPPYSEEKRWISENPPYREWLKNAHERIKSVGDDPADFFCNKNEALFVYAYLGIII
jgi:hypothetical protein